MNASEIRQQFLDFFKSKGHAIVPSSPVVPLDDPTLLFANAGMNQFKDVFLGTGSRPFRRAADTQKCIRAGGKHNDLDDVGKDTYHHTFFEMLGNWSFGDYFKAEAIAWAWELLTKVWGIEPQRLHATYFQGDPAEGLEPDLEARDLWLKMPGMTKERVHPGTKKDNFWEMGDTGPCGPCSEIHIDLTEDRSGGRLVNAGDARVMEIWNLVFIQYNRGADGKLVPLPARHVDTGMGFERICAVLQSKRSNYDTDVFAPIFAAIQQRTKGPDYQGTLPGDEQRPAGKPVPQAQVMIDVSYRVIADHIRTLTFALTDGAVPSNEGRGYVLRRILRRGVRYGRQYLNMHEPFLADLVAPLIAHMGAAFPELRTAHGGRNAEHVANIIREEEESFGRTLDRGIRLFAEAAEEAVRHHHGRITGADAFKLHDTYGFPIDLTELMAEERGLTVDIGEYERLADAAREQARASAADTDVHRKAAEEAHGQKPQDKADDRAKYDDKLEVATQISALTRFADPRENGPAREGDELVFSLTSTCFYAEQGGQVGDRGVFEADKGTIEVTDVQRRGDYIFHYGRVLRGEVASGASGVARVDRANRGPIMQNHTSTHLLNWALREVLGMGVDQKGSLVDAEKTRFDFSHGKPVTPEEIARVEQLVNEQIDRNLPVYAKEVPQAEARRINTLRAVFGEKYPDIVRVVSIGADIDAMLKNPDDPRWMGYSVEFCGGTHLQSSVEAQHFVLVTEEGVAKGVRRVVGISGQAARQAEETGKALAARIAALAGANAEKLLAELPAVQKELADAVTPLRVRHQLREQLAELQKKAKEADKQQAAASGEQVAASVQALFAEAPTIGGVTVVVGEVPPAHTDALRAAIDWVRNKSEASAVALGMAEGGKVTLIAGMSRVAVERGLKAGDLVREITPLVGGKGGGRPDMAQGGGTDPARLPQALSAARAWIAAKLGG